MQQTGEYRIDAPRVAVWQALNDPEVLARCIEGCQALVRVDDHCYRAVIKARLGPLRATFQADLDVTDIDAPERYRLRVRVSGDSAGAAEGTADVRLHDVHGATRLTYDVNGSVSGTLAEIDARLIDGMLRKRADDFFSCFNEHVVPEVVKEQDVEEQGVKEQPLPRTTPAAAAEPPRVDGQWRVWAIIAAALAASIFLAMMAL